MRFGAVGAAWQQKVFLDHIHLLCVKPALHTMINCIRLMAGVNSFQKGGYWVDARGQNALIALSPPALINKRQIFFLLNLF